MFEIYRTRPILSWSLTGLGLLLLLWLFWPRAKSTGVVAVSGAVTPTDAQINAQTAVQVANIQAAAATHAGDQQNMLQLAALAVQEKLGELGYASTNQQNTQAYNLAIAQIAATQRETDEAALLQGAKTRKVGRDIINAIHLSPGVVLPPPPPAPGG